MKHPKSKAKPESVAPAKAAAKPQPDEITDALRALVVEAEQAGARDRPSVSRAKELLTRLEPKNQ